MKNLIFASSLLAAFITLGCTKRESAKEVWIYTSLYKDTIADLTPRLEKTFPGVKFNFFQAGSEEIATKVNAEMLSGETKADILISSDRFWYEDLGSKGKLHGFKPPAGAGVPAELRHADGWYATVSIPVMVLSYNKEAAEKSHPKTFKDLGDPKFKGQVTIGSPLASGTNFTTVAFLLDAYGWDYFKTLRKNEVLSEGGNSAVLKRVQTKEKPIGWVLMENILRLQGKDDRVVTILPDDGVILHSNVLAIVKKQGDLSLKEKVADWFFQKEGQEAMTRSYMYSPLKDFDAPQGAPKFADLKTKTFAWSPEFIQKTMKEREKIKEEFTKIMYE